MNTKFFYLLLLLFTTTYASDQLLVVLSKSFNSSTAMLQRYEKTSKLYTKVSTPIRVNLGKNGLAWGKSSLLRDKSTITKHKKEGDLKSPAGLFELPFSFGYSPKFETQSRYRHATKSLICVDDSHSKYYNTLIPITSSIELKSFEWMRRDDNLYKLGIFVNHNEAQIKEAGSCIFLHVQKGYKSPTSGCTSMREDDLEAIIKWLDRKSTPLLLQIPHTECQEFNEVFKGIDCTIF